MSYYNNLRDICGKGLDTGRMGPLEAGIEKNGPIFIYKHHALVFGEHEQC